MDGRRRVVDAAVSVADTRAGVTNIFPNSTLVMRFAVFNFDTHAHRASGFRSDEPTRVRNLYVAYVAAVEQARYCNRSQRFE
jgi:hypothetical protein